jgi:hypothetical protein
MCRDTSLVLGKIVLLLACSFCLTVLHFDWLENSQMSTVSMKLY